MRWILLFPVLSILLVAPAAGGDGEALKSAFELEVRPSALSAVEVVTMESAPPLFALKAKLELPSPGYEPVVKSLQKADARGRMVATVTVKRLPGSWAQVVTKKAIRIDLGTLKPGSYAVDVDVAYEDKPVHRAGTVLVAARGR